MVNHRSHDRATTMELLPSQRRMRTWSLSGPPGQIRFDGLKRFARVGQQGGCIFSSCRIQTRFCITDTTAEHLVIIVFQATIAIKSVLVYPSSLLLT